MNRHDTKEQFKKAQGLINETAGNIFGRKSREQKGRKHSIPGQVQDDYADARDRARSGG